MGWHNGLHLVGVCCEKETKSVVAEIEDRQLEAQFSVGDCFAGLGVREEGSHGMILRRGDTASSLMAVCYSF
jgi:hypothetical protein